MKFSLVLILFLFCILLLNNALACLPEDTNHTVKLHFLYGSKPKKKYRNTESKYFGGIHGGHVSIQIDSLDYGFIPTGKVHIFSHRKKKASRFVIKNVKGYDPYPDSSKVTTVEFMVPDPTFRRLRATIDNYCANLPFDYAFFGMRCAAAAQDIFGHAKMLPERHPFVNVLTTFYPRKLKRRILRMAEKKHLTVKRREGRVGRKWEKE